MVCSSSGGIILYTPCFLSDNGASGCMKAFLMLCFEIDLTMLSLNFFVSHKSALCMLPRKSSPDKEEQSLATFRMRLIVNRVKMAPWREAFLMRLDCRILLNFAHSEKKCEPSEAWQRVFDGRNTKESVVELQKICNPAMGNLFCSVMSDSRSESVSRSAREHMI